MTLNIYFGDIFKGIRKLLAKIDQYTQENPRMAFFQRKILGEI